MENNLTNKKPRPGLGLTQINIVEELKYDYATVFSTKIRFLEQKTDYIEYY